MEFFPRPENCTYDHFQVPFVTNTLDRNLDLQQDFEDVTEAALCSSDSPERLQILGTRLQSRTFFGTISRFLRRNVDLDEYRSFDREGRPIVSTLHFYNTLKENWIHAESGVSRKALLAMLQTTWDCLDRIDQRTTLHKGYIPLLVLASKLLVGSLAVSMGDQVSGHNRIELLDSSSYLQGLSTGALSSQMAKFGACPRDILRLIITFGLLTCYYLSFLLRDSQPGVAHSSCTADTCVAYNVDEETYETQHVDSQCTCSFININMEKLTYIISRGKIPIVKVLDHSSGQPKLMVEEATSQSSYIAISHVWQHGYVRLFVLHRLSSLIF